MLAQALRPLIAVAVLFAVLAALIACSLTSRWCKRRLGHARPMLGAARGSVVALDALLVCTVSRAVLFPGAQEVLASLAGQLVISGFGLGTVVWGLGAVAERLFLQRRKSA